MNKTLISLTGLAVVVSLLALALSIGKPQQIVKTITERVGSVSSPDISSPYFSFGDVRFWAAKDTDLTAATTTVCALQSPVSTSTLISASIRLDVSTTSATIVTMAKSATAFATTTALATWTTDAGEQGTLNATTSSLVSNNPDGFQVFAPNQWIVVGMQGGGSTACAAGTCTYSPVGTCEAVWIEN